MRNKKTPELDTPALSEDMRGPELRDAFRVFLGFDLRLLVTIRDLILHPIRVARDAVNGNKETYLGQVRLFVFLLGAQTVFFILMKTYDSMSVSSIIADADLLAQYTDVMTKRGINLDQINDEIRNWINLLITPLSLFFLLSFTVFFKILSPRTTFLGHLILLMTANNAATLIGVPVAVIAVNVTKNAVATNMLMIPFQMFYIGLFIWAFMRKTILGGITKIIVLIVLSVIISAIIGILMMVVINMVIARDFGVAPWFFLIQETLKAAQATASP
ncbi:MAG: hypothetical protein Q9M33_03590 [Robiginitomaculum sp.]|nr:hypothetical protein [Robiginitomaculum sp.]MDQ7077476.1 hypothetical protein [Robiginitomaculum sp.]